jgi:hypothetical protein
MMGHFVEEGPEPTPEDVQTSADVQTSVELRAVEQIELFALEASVQRSFHDRSAAFLMLCEFEYASDGTTSFYPIYNPNHTPEAPMTEEQERGLWQAALIAGGFMPKLNIAHPSHDLSIAELRARIHAALGCTDNPITDYLRR